MHIKFQPGQHVYVVEEGDQLWRFAIAQVRVSSRGTEYSGDPSLKDSRWYLEADCYGTLAEILPAERARAETRLTALSEAIGEVLENAVDVARAKSISVYTTEGAQQA